MLHGQMLHRQMLHGQMLHGQMLHGQIVLGHLSTVNNTISAQLELGLAGTGAELGNSLLRLHYDLCRSSSSMSF